MREENGLQLIRSMVLGSIRAWSVGDPGQGGNPVRSMRRRGILRVPGNRLSSNDGWEMQAWAMSGLPVHTAESLTGAQ